MVHCAVVGCTNHNNRPKTHLNNIGLTKRYFRFPIDPFLAKQWVIKSKRTDLLNLREHFICSDHFTKQDYELSLRCLVVGGYRPRLKRYAVPTQNLPGRTQSVNSKKDSTKKINLLTKSSSIENIDNIIIETENDIIVKSINKVHKKQKQRRIEVKNEPIEQDKILNKTFNMSTDPSNKKEIYYIKEENSELIIEIEPDDKDEVIKIKDEDKQDAEHNIKYEVTNEITCTNPSYTDGYKKSLSMCNICSLVFLDDHELALHTDIWHLTNIDDDHVLKKMRYKSSEIIPKIIGGKTKYKCHSCSKSYKFPFNLSRHIKNMHKEHPFECNICKNTFATSDQLARHIGIHAEPHSFQCTVCKQIFIDKIDLDNHFKDHLTRSGFVCNFCEILSASATHLTRHLEREHTDKLPFSCNVCDKSYGTSEEITTHMYIHTMKRVEKFKCRDCPKIYQNKSQLEAHCKFTDHKLYNARKCGMCNEEFNLKKQLRRHIQHVHKDERDVIIKETIEAIISSTSSSTEASS